ncbi:hypothetical protein MMC30_005473 [Trapelia coarctata]|nr:hypothetical protein [Trapelia coarctata]
MAVPPVPQPLSFPPLTYAKLSPRAFLAAHLDSPTNPARPNTRAPHAFRPPTVNTSSLTHANGSAVIRCGDTAVVCGVRAEVLRSEDVGYLRINAKGKGAARERKDDDREDGGEGNEEGEDGDRESEERDRDTIADLGLLVPNIELATGCSPLYMPGNPPSTLAQSLSQRVLTLLHISNLVPFEQLQIWHTPAPLTTTATTPKPKPASISTAPDAPDVRMEEASDSDSNSSAEDNGVKGEEEGKEAEVKAFWTLYIDILFISLDGNAFDAAWMAVLTALRHTRLPRAWWDADREMVVCSPSMAEGRKLGLRGAPVASTFGVFERAKGGMGGVGEGGEEQKGEEKYILADLDDFEESLCDEQVTVVVDRATSGTRKGKGKEMKLLRIEKSGGGVVGVEEMRACVQMAEGRWKQWRAV